MEQGSRQKQKQEILELLKKHNVTKVGATIDLWANELGEEWALCLQATLDIHALYMFQAGLNKVFEGIGVVVSMHLHPYNNYQITLSWRVIYT